LSLNDVLCRMFVTATFISTILFSHSSIRAPSSICLLSDFVVPEPVWNVFWLLLQYLLLTSCHRSLIKLNNIRLKWSFYMMNSGWERNMRFNTNLWKWKWSRKRGWLHCRNVHLLSWTRFCQDNSWGESNSGI
jgi:hypothetical protein